MTTSYTSLLGLALPTTGELQGTWGDTVNNSITSLLDSAVAGTTTLSTDGDVTLSTTTGAANQSRQSILLCSGARTALRTITAPAQSKIYTVINATTGGYSVKVVGVGPTTGVTIVAGESALIAWNGSDFIKISNTGGAASFTNVTVTGTTTLSGLTASTALALDASKNVVSVTNTGTGNNVLASSPTLTTPNLGTPSAVTLTNATGLPLTTGVTGTLPTTNGGTGLTSFTANGVVYASSTSALTTGSALTFDGTNLSSTGGATFLGSPSGFGGGEVRLGPTTADTQSSISTQSTGTPQLIFDHRGTSNAGVFIWRNGTGGASEQMRLTSTGLGIGTSSPGAKLHIGGTGAGAAQAILTNGVSDPNFQLWVTNGETGATNGTIQSSIRLAYSGVGYGPGISLTRGGGTTDGSLLLETSGVTKATLDSSGNLGLGVTPTAGTGDTKHIELPAGGVFRTLGVNADFGANYYYNSAYVYATTGAATRFEQNSGVFKWFTAPSGTAGNAITFTQAMTLDASGQLQIGTTTADGMLTVSAPANTSYGSFNAATSGFANLTFKTSGTAYAYMGSANAFVAGGTANDFAIRSQNALTFATGGSTERARIDSSGNFGIGTSSPVAKLNVQADDTNTIARQIVISGATTSNKRLYLGFNTSTNVGTIQAYQESFGSRDLVLQPDSGNLGLGVTPSAWSLRAFQIGSCSLSVAGSSGTQLLTSANSYYDGTNFRYIASDNATYYRQTTGQHQWYTAPSGTAGNAITFTQAMTLDASGNLGVGTTSPVTQLHLYKASGTVAVTAQSGANYGYFGNDGTYTYLGSSVGSTGVKFRVALGAPDNSATIDSSGNLLVGTTSGSGRLRVVNTSDPGGTVIQFIEHNSTSDSLRIDANTGGTAGTAVYVLPVRTAGTLRGGIQWDGTNLLYNNTSDYRLKENVQPMVGALAKVAALKPCTYRWKETGNTGQGFIAHELQEVVPDAVAGKKDAVDAEGKPVYQGIDTSFLVATLTAAIQEQQAIIEQLTSRLEALEAK